MDKNSLDKDYYKKNWRNPIRRLWKKVMPIVLASFGVVGLMITFFSLIPWLLTEQGEQIMIAIQTFLAVGLATFVAISSYYISMRHRSKFAPIRIRIRREMK